MYLDRVWDIGSHPVRMCADRQGPDWIIDASDHRNKASMTSVRGPARPRLY